MHRLTVVIPTYNEAENLARIVDRIFALHPTLHIIVVDDNSPDGTGPIADNLSKKYSHLHVIHRPHKAGLGTAYVEGFKEALAKGADLIIEMDADFSHDPEYLQVLLELFEWLFGTKFQVPIMITYFAAHENLLPSRSP